MTISQDSPDSSKSVALTIDAACLIALTGFLLSFIRASNRTYGSLMIIVLTLSYFGYPIISIYALYSFPNENPKPTRTEGSIYVVISIFNLYWSAAFAVFTYLAAKSAIAEKSLNFKVVISLITLTCLTATLLFPFLIYLNVWGDHVFWNVPGSQSIGCYIDDSSAKVSFMIVRDLIGKLIPTTATSIYYFKLYNLLKDSRETENFSRKTLWRLFIVSTIPLICSLPGILVDFSKEFYWLYTSQAIPTIMVLLGYFWEFLNLWAYWKLNPTKKQTLSSRSSLRMSNALLPSEL